MSGRYRFVLAPRWMLGHVLVLAAFLTMVLLGRWQLDVSNSKHFSLQNFAYSIQWWAFSVFAVLMWIRIIRDASGQSKSATPGTAGPAPTGSTAMLSAPAEVAYRRYVPPSAPVAETDPIRMAYNDYLAALARRDELHPAGPSADRGEPAAGSDRTPEGDA
ncbi:MAG: hypothetical protein JO147_04505 [Actinobacteria bacterium]|nr:hypothetical protein [Actinomycetota bacterium]